jgi:hypothetical protein
MLKTSAYGRANYQIKNTLSTAYTPIKDKDIEIETEENRESARFIGGEEQNKPE